MRRFCYSFLMFILPLPVRSASEGLPNTASTKFQQFAAARQAISTDHFQETLLAEAIFQETNQKRSDLKLPAFLPDGRASQAARLHARWMARTRLLAHDEATASGSSTTALARLVQQGIHPHTTAENVAYNFLLDLVPGKAFYARLEHGRRVYSYRSGGTPLLARTYTGFARVIVDQWMHSPLHRAHIINPGLRYLGVGAALSRRAGHPDTIYAAQDFFTPTFSLPAGVGPAEATLMPSRPQE